MKINPFQPCSIAAPGYFAGRFAEMRALDEGLFQTKNGNPWHFLIHGEAGIGKSSLLLVTEATATGDIPTMEDRLTFNFVVISISLDPNNSSADLIRKVGKELSVQLKTREIVKSVLKTGWEFLTRWEAVGVKYNAQDRSTTDAELLDELADAFIAAESRLGPNIDGFLILIDEAHKGSETAQLGAFIKLFTERLTKRNCNRVLFGLAGLSDVIDILKKSHESSVRILHTMLLEPFAPAERLDAVRRAIEAGNTKNRLKTAIQPDAAQFIADLSEGYPHFIQQYGYSAFQVDMDNNITIEDVRTGAYAENGALDQLGARYFEGMYSEQINSDDYRRVLRTMAADTAGEYMVRKNIKSASGVKDTTLNNALSALSAKRIILRHPEKPGLYKLPSGSFRAWILARAIKEQQRSLPVPLPPQPSSQS